MRRREKKSANEEQTFSSFRSERPGKEFSVGLDITPTLGYSPTSSQEAGRPLPCSVLREVKWVFSSEHRAKPQPQQEPGGHKFNAPLPRGTIHPIYDAILAAEKARPAGWSAAPGLQGCQGKGHLLRGPRGSRAFSSICQVSPCSTGEVTSAGLSLSSGSPRTPGAAT